MKGEHKPLNSPTVGLRGIGEAHEAVTSGLWKLIDPAKLFNN